MKDNGKETAIQNNPIIRETRKELKKKLSEIEELIFDKLHAIKAARVDSLEQEITLKDSIIDGLKKDKQQLLGQLMSYSPKLHKLEKENEKLIAENARLKSIHPGRKYSIIEMKKAILATLVEANFYLNQVEGKPIISIDKMGLFIFRVLQDPNEMVPQELRSYWGDK